MNIVHKVTIRHLKENKRRTLVTIIGVIISVAMITAVATLSASFMDLFLRHHIANNGEWHVQYKNVNKDQIDIITQDGNTKKVVLANSSYSLLENSQYDFKPYLYFQHFNEAGMEQFPIEVKEGRLPNNENEIAISEAIIKQAKVDFKIGDELTFEIGERIHKTDGSTLSQNDSLVRNEEGIIEEFITYETKTFTVVGIIERPNWEVPWAPGYTVIGYVDENSLSPEDTVDAFVVLNKIKRSLYEHANHLAKSSQIEEVIFNSELLRYYGVTNNKKLQMTFFSLTGIIIAIILIGSVALIYNAFAISVSERARHLGMLSSVGATKKQKRNSVFFEGAVIGAISIPIGILAGIAGIGVTFLYINKYLNGALGITEKLQLVVTPLSIFIAVIISIVTIFISTYIPAQRASKISAIEAIRQTHDIKLASKTVKTSKLVRKIFGIEAEIGLKNLKRNKKRYFVTLFSLIVSIVLFLSVTYFTESIKKSVEMTQDDIKYDILVYSDQEEMDQLKQFTQVDHVTKATLMEKAELHTYVTEEQLSPQLKQQEFDLHKEENGYFYNVSLHSLDEQSFKEYAEQIGLNVNEFLNQDHLPAIVIETISYQDYQTRKIVETNTIETEAGETFDLFTTIYNDEGTEELGTEYIATMKVVALTDEAPIGVTTSMLGGINVIIPQSTMDQLNISKYPYVYLNSSDPMATQSAIEKGNDLSIYVYNIFERRQQNEQIVLLLSIFTYGFITLISLISIANILNTISTSIRLRKREFAMLRSVGMTPKSFDKMIYYESIFYGVKAIIYGLPISILIMYSIHQSLGFTFDYAFTLPWTSLIIVILMIFLIVGLSMFYSIAKIRKDNIIESLKQENI